MTASTETATGTLRVDTWSSASRQHRIDTGVYLDTDGDPADVTYSRTEASRRLAVVSRQVATADGLGLHDEAADTRAERDHLTAALATGDPRIIPLPGPDDSAQDERTARSIEEHERSL